MRPRTSLALLLSSLLLPAAVVGAPAAAAAPPPAPPPPVVGNLVIDGVDGSTEPGGVKVYTLGDVTGMVIIRNSRNIVIRGAARTQPYTCRIAPNNPNLPGLTFYNVHGLTIQNCEVSNAKQGIWADTLRNGVYASSSDITIRRNYFHDVVADGMQFKRYDGQFAYDFDRVRILDNEFAAWGQGSKDDFLFHGIYMKADDALIQGNYFRDGWGGDAITIRSAGTVRRNVIADPNDVGGISYYAQIDSRGSSGRLVIEDNLVYTDATADTTRKAVATATLNLGGLGGDPLARLDYLVPFTSVRFNTTVVRGRDGLPITRNLFVDPKMADPTRDDRVEVYGNLFVDTRVTKNFTFGEEFVDYYRYNALRPTADGLTTDTPDRRGAYRLTPAAGDLIDQIPAVALTRGGYRIPAVDLDGDRRPTGRNALLDYGADEYRARR